MVSRDIEQHSELTQNLISILQDIYPEKDGSFLNDFAEGLANQAQKNPSPHSPTTQTLENTFAVILLLAEQHSCPLCCYGRLIKSVQLQLHAADAEQR